MHISFKQVVLWVLFWPFLLPYIIFKKFIFKGKYSKTLSTISALAIIFVFYTIGNQNNGPEIHYVTKKVGTNKVKLAKEKQSILEKERDSKQAEYNSLSEEYSSYQESEKDEKSSSIQSRHQAEAQSKEKETADQKASENNESAPTSHGDMNTATTGTIVGNSRSHIYHVPGQAGYRMNSANAVYFNSEQEAINAGYRKAKR